jgi:hypothetical protein
MVFYSLSLLAVKKSLHIVSPSSFILCIDVLYVSQFIYLLCAWMLKLWMCQSICYFIHSTEWFIINFVCVCDSFDD